MTNSSALNLKREREEDGKASCEQEIADAFPSFFVLDKSIKIYMN